MEKRSRLTFRKFFLGAVVTLLALCLVLAGATVLINRSLHQQAPTDDRLTAVNKARIAEAIHLRKALGEQVLPGFGRANIPIIVYNEKYAFLIGLDSPKEGWLTIPERTQTGSLWEKVPGDDYYGSPYYRQRLADQTTPQSFTVLIGDRYTASLGDLEWMKLNARTGLVEQLPESIRPLVPSFLMVYLLFPNSDIYITALDHESMHAYQGMRASERLDAAEQAAKASAHYPYDDPSFKSSWQAELNLLNEAVRAPLNTGARDLAKKFLAQRAARRQNAGLSADMVAFERGKEWEEGIAKYAELSIYRLPSTSTIYAPISEMKADDQFKAYKGFQQKWDQEVYQIRLEAGAEKDMRFYYTGFAQAVLLDRLSPGWKDHLFDEGIWLEDLLAAAVQ